MLEIACKISSCDTVNNFCVLLAYFVALTNICSHSYRFLAFLFPQFQKNVTNCFIRLLLFKFIVYFDYFLTSCFVSYRSSCNFLFTVSIAGLLSGVFLACLLASLVADSVAFGWLVSCFDAS